MNPVWGRVLVLRGMILLGCVLFAGLSPVLVQQPVTAQPNPGIDPCSRALATAATPVAEGPPDISSIRLEVSQTIMNFASCFNRQNMHGMVALSSPEFRESLLGASDEAVLKTRLEELDSRGLLSGLRIQSIDDNGTTGSKLAMMVVTWRAWNDIHKELWRAQPEDGYWKLTGRSIQAPLMSGSAVGVRFGIEADGLRSPLDSLANPGSVLLAFQNPGETDQRALVLAAEPGETAESVLQRCAASDARLEPVGSVQVLANETSVMPLVELPAGRYAVIVAGDPCMTGETVSAAHISMVDITDAVDG